MLEIGHAGRLGNQMFQWAVLRALSVKYGLPIRIPVSKELHLIDAFNVPFEPLTSNNTDYYNIIESGFHYQPLLLTDDRSVNLQGYFQSFKYFSSIEDTIRQDLTFKPIFRERCSEYLSSIRKDGYQLVSIHVRRTDYIDKDHSFAYIPVDRGYCQTALSILKVKLNTDKLQVLYFSDDIEWCKKNLPQNEDTFFPNRSDIEDMCLMSMCDHNIIAGSTFSWWAAWLNTNKNKTVISPKHWFTPYFESVIKYREEDLLPKDWILI